jgi:hypothetical protein
MLRKEGKFSDDIIKGEAWWRRTYHREEKPEAGVRSPVSIGQSGYETKEFVEFRAVTGEAGRPPQKV